MKLLSIFATCVYSSNKTTSKPKTISNTKITEPGPIIYHERQYANTSTCGANAIDNLYQSPGMLYDHAALKIQQKIDAVRNDPKTEFDIAIMDDKNLMETFCADGINHNYDFNFIKWLMKTVADSTGVQVAGTFLAENYTAFNNFKAAFLTFLKNKDGILIRIANSGFSGHFYSLRKYGRYWYLLDSMYKNPIKITNTIINDQFRIMFKYKAQIVGVEGVRNYNNFQTNKPTILTEEESKKSKDMRKYVQMNPLK